MKTKDKASQESSKDQRVDTDESPVEDYQKIANFKTFDKQRYSNSMQRTNEIQFATFNENNPLQKVKGMRSTDEFINILEDSYGQEDCLVRSTGGSQQAKAKKNQFSVE